MKLDIYDKKIMQQIGTPFWYWTNYSQLTITEKDLEYLQTIRAHPCFQLIDKSSNKKTGIEFANAMINQIVFFEHFYNAFDCPPNIRKILFCIIGQKKGSLEYQNWLDLLNFRYPYVEQWLNSVTQKSSR